MKDKNGNYKYTEEESTLVPGENQYDYEEESTTKLNYEEEETYIPGEKKEKEKRIHIPKKYEKTDENKTFIPGIKRKKKKKVNKFQEKEDSTIILTDNTDNTAEFELSEEDEKKFPFIPSQKIIFTIVALIVLISSLVTALKIYENNKKKLMKLEAQKKELKLKSKINDLYLLGINEYKLKNWESSENYFSDLIKLKPDFKKAEEYLKSIEKEKKYKKILKNAQELLKEKKYEEAKKEAEKIGNNSVYYSEVKILIEKAENLKITEEEEKEKKLLEEELKKEMEEAENEDIENIEKEEIKTIKKRKKHSKKYRKKKIKNNTKKVTKELLEKLNNLYIVAYQNERRYPKKAARTYKKIINSLPATEKLYQKAKKRLSKIKIK